MATVIRDYWKWFVGAIGIVALAYVLSPTRTLPAARSKDVVEIAFMGPHGLLLNGFEDVVRAFERKSLAEHQKDPSKKIYKVIMSEGAAYDQVADPTRFMISVAGGEPPDAMIFDRYAIAEWAARGGFRPLDEFIEADLKNNVPGAIRPEDFYDNVWAEANYQGKVFAIPKDVDNRLLVYNKDMLRRAGLVDSETGEVRPPRTWEEMREWNKKLIRKNEFGQLQSVGFAPNMGNSWLYMYGWMAGGEFMSPDGRTVTLNEPRIQRALQFMVDMYDDMGGFKQVEAFRAGLQGGMLDPLVTGQVAMRIDTSNIMSFLERYAKDIDFGVAPAPMPADRVAAGAEPVTWSGGFSFAIPINAHKPEAAWELIRFAASDEGMRVFAEGEKEVAAALGFRFIPSFTPKPKLNEELTAKYVFSDPTVNDRVKEGVRVALDMLPLARFRPVTPVGQVLWNYHVTSMEDALYKRKGVKQALDYGTFRVQRELNRFFEPPKGYPVKFNWFFIGYGLLVITVVTLVYLWDTRPAIRAALLRPFRGRREIGIGDVVEGARGGFFRSQWRAGFLCALPWIIGFIIFGGGPLMFSVVMSFCDYDVINPPRFVGLRNYKFFFFEDELAPKAFFNTAFMLLGIPIGITAGLCVALLLNMKLRGMNVFRTLFYLPVVVPAIATMMLWMWVFNPAAGPLNTALAHLGIQGPSWLQDMKWSKPALILMGLWGVGGGMVIWLAGLRNISPQLYEAAELDGAGNWRKFTHITLPQLSPYIFFNLVMGLIAGFQIFDEAFVMTHGGPVNSTLFYVYHLFNNAFRYGHMGYACAMAWVLFVCILGLTVVQMKLAKRWVHYEGD